MKTTTLVGLAAAALWVGSAVTASATAFPPAKGVIGDKFPAGNAVGFDEPILFLDPDPLAAVAGLADDVGYELGPGTQDQEGPYGEGVRAIVIETGFHPGGAPKY
jgi:hypothetical protein